MTPATPPRSRNTRYSKEFDAFNGLVSTPHRNVTGGGEDGGPITPGTATGKPIMMINNSKIPLLHPQNELESPSTCLKSPEYTPHRPPCGRRRSLFQESELQTTSRVLFPVELKEGAIPSGRLIKKYSQPVALCLRDKLQDEEGTEGAPTLLPPKWTCAASSTLQEEKLVYDLEEEEVSEHETEFPFDHEHRRKYAKQVPGTPTDKLVTFELAKDWNNNSAFISSSEEEDEGVDIKQVQIPNIFLSNKVASPEVRRQRTLQLLQEDPDLATTVTYVNKRGKVVEKRELDPEEQELFKPKMLFSKDLEDSTPVTRENSVTSVNSN